MCRVQKVWCSSSPHDKIWGVCWPQIYSCGAPECRPRQCEHSETHSASHWLDHIRSIFIFFQFTTVRFKGQSKGKWYHDEEALEPSCGRGMMETSGEVGFEKKGLWRNVMAVFRYWPGSNTGVQFWVYLIQTKLLKNFKFEDLNAI